MMLRRKQVIAMASIVVVAFLMGTMFNVNLLTTAKDENDGRPVWETYVTGVNATALPDVWNVNVQNWPVSTDVNVWWSLPLDPGYSVGSSHYNANGFSQLHVLACESGLGATERVWFSIYGLLWNAEHTGFVDVKAANFTLDGCHYTAALTIPVPSEEFYFTAYTMDECEVSLSFYLTWA